jgi:hypothetical protein
MRVFLDMAAAKYGKGPCTPWRPPPARQIGGTLDGVRVLLCALLVCAAFAPALANPASAAHAKRCGIVAKGASDYRVKGRSVRCRFARKWSRAYLRERAEPRGFTCYRPGTSISFYCAKGGKAYWGERL